MTARAFSIGRKFPGETAEYIPFRSDKSLFDADVIIFTPTFRSYRSFEHYQGRPLISESDSAQLLTDCAHWRNELKTAVETGKVVFVPLAKPDEVYYDTGRRTHSGTGRSRVTTHTVARASSYLSLPVELEGIVPKCGTEMSVLADLGAIALYWSEFGSNSEYQVYFDPKGLKPLIGTKKREKVVGGVINTVGGGALVLLPPVIWDEKALTYMRGESTYWRKEGITFGKRLLSAIISTSDALRRGGKRTPSPEWSLEPAYLLAAETRLKIDASKVEREIEDLAKRLSELEKQIEEAAALRALLYETGKPLEAAIIGALRLLGFVAEPFKEGESEFDAVFTSAEGRFLGEAEGKETKAINIDKMSQLERNLEEDFKRDATTEFAKGVLFGNAYRLSPLVARGEFFTEKCVKAAKRRGVALVRTPDLFFAAQYLSERADEVFAGACRRAMFEACGTIVAFPAPKVQGSDAVT